jgi:hypothetical protein
MPVIPVLGRRIQEDLEFKDSLGCIERPCFKKQDKTKVLNPQEWKKRKKRKKQHKSEYWKANRGGAIYLVNMSSLGTPLDYSQSGQNSQDLWASSTWKEVREGNCVVRKGCLKALEKVMRSLGLCLCILPLSHPGEWLESCALQRAVDVP